MTCPRCFRPMIEGVAGATVEVFGGPRFQTTVVRWVCVTPRCGVRVTPETRLTVPELVA